MSNFIIVLKPLIIKKTKNNYIQYLQLPKNKKNKFYVVKTTYDSIDYMYNLVNIKNKDVFGSIHVKFYSQIL